MLTAQDLQPVKTKARIDAATASSVIAKVTARDSNSHVIITQYGGKECYLAQVGGLGPCFVVRGGRHRRNEGLFVPLRLLHRTQPVLGDTDQGKLTVRATYLVRDVSWFIDCPPTNADPDNIPNLKRMERQLRNPQEWKTLEITKAIQQVVKSSGGSGAGQRRGRAAAAGNKTSGEAEVEAGNKTARDKCIDLSAEKKFENLGADEDDDDDYTYTTRRNGKDEVIGSDDDEYEWVDWNDEAGGEEKENAKSGGPAPPPNTAAAKPQSKALAAGASKSKQ
jgi:hypothetical protein